MYPISEPQWPVQRIAAKGLPSTMTADKKLKMAGARIDAALWNKFAATAKMNGKSVAEALEAALRAALPANGKAKR